MPEAEFLDHRGLTELPGVAAQQRAAPPFRHPLEPAAKLDLRWNRLLDLPPRGGELQQRCCIVLS
jgi:hypothetical protein